MSLRMRLIMNDELGRAKFEKLLSISVAALGVDEEDEVHLMGQPLHGLIILLS